MRPQTAPRAYLTYSLTPQHGENHKLQWLWSLAFVLFWLDQLDQLLENSGLGGGPRPDSAEPNSFGS